MNGGYLGVVLEEEAEELFFEGLAGEFAGEGDFEEVVLGEVFDAEKLVEGFGGEAEGDVHLVGMEVDVAPGLDFEGVGHVDIDGLKGDFFVLENGLDGGAFHLEVFVLFLSFEEFAFGLAGEGGSLDGEGEGFFTVAQAVE